MTGDRLIASPSDALSGQVRVQGDKSISHRALILGALARGETRIEGLLESLDVLATAEAVRAFGARVERIEEGVWLVEGGPWQTPERPIDCGNSGTSARLLMGAAAAFPIEATFTGDASLRSRPMDRVLEPLRSMGATVLASDEGRLPVTLAGGDLRGISFRNKRASAQVKSAVLLAGLGAAGEVEVTEPEPSRDHTEHLLESFGCDISYGRGFARLGVDRALTGTLVRIPGDPSSAAFPLVAALLVPGSHVSLQAVAANPLRNGLLTTLGEMGADIRVSPRGNDVADLEVRRAVLHGVEVPASRVPSMVDEYPALAVAAAHASGRTVMRGLSELRVKESDRLAAIVEGLQACGVEASIEGDDLIVEGCGAPPAGGATVSARGDHRIAMSMLVLGLAARAPVTVDSASAIPTSFPDFAASMRRLGADIA
jgi:3-phosphoshikimate 1-carboxyvinyltransferase